ncbi:MAG TPA: hypothetical protein ENK02_15430 [Planctomycetes bacterium]|nr:hypothetical protein [Planctomycetota bacterium]
MKQPRSLMPLVEILLSAFGFQAIGLFGLQERIQPLCLRAGGEPGGREPGGTPILDTILTGPS